MHQQKKNIFELKINTNGSFLTEDICHSIFKNNISQIIVSSDHYIKDKYEKLRVGSNFEKIVSKVDMLYEIRKKYYPDSFTEIRISGIDNEKNLDREKFYEFWIKRSDHVTAGFPLERWDTYKNEIHNQIKDPCENLWDRMYVWFDGKVNPCDADYKSYLSYGNVKNQSIKEIWNNNIIEKTRINHLNENRKSIVPCNKCGVTFC
jgi:radical SAM protein with 4Fe4S-binding SPASM domain